MSYKVFSVLVKQRYIYLYENNLINNYNYGSNVYSNEPISINQVQTLREECADSDCVCDCEE